MSQYDPEDLKIQTSPERPQNHALQQQPMYYPAPSGGGGVMLVVLFFGCLTFGLVIYELYFVSTENSLIVRIYSKLGQGEAEIADQKEKDEAELEYALQTAKSEADRMTKAYETLYTNYAQIYQQAVQWEGMLFQSQLEALDSTQAVDKLGANIAGIGCLLGQFSGDRSLCGAKEAMQNDILKQKKELLVKHRSNLPQSILDSLPKPRDLLSNEFKALAQKYPTKLGHKGG